MKKRNLILQAAVAGLFCAVTLSANAGSTATAVGNSAQIATEAALNSSVIGSGKLAYTVLGAIPVGTYYIYVQVEEGASFYTGASGTTTSMLGGGSLAAGVTTAAGVLNISTGATAAGTATVGTGTVLGGNTSIVAFPITVTAALPANTTFTFQPTANTAGDGGITGAYAAATTPANNNTLNAQMSLGASASYASTLTSIVSDEAAIAGGAIATFIPGINSSALSSGSFSTVTTNPGYLYDGVGKEEAVIDVLGGATGVTLTGNINVAASTAVLDLGGFYFADVSTDAAGAGPYGADGITTFNLATDYAAGTIAATVTAPTGFFNVANQAGGSVALFTDADCTGPVAGATASISTNGSTATFSFTSPAAATVDANEVDAGFAATSSIVGPMFVCVTAPGTNAVSWVSGTPSITATLTSATPTTVGSVPLAATSLYALGSNGGSAYVREYIPSTVSGYTSYIRVINTGNVAANINAAVVSDVTGLTGTAGTIGTSVPPGGAITVSSTQVEAAIVTAGGVAPTSSMRPRLLVTAPTTIAVQSYISDANGNFSEVSGGNVGNLFDTGVTANVNPFNQ